MKVMTASEKEALLGLCEIYKLLANKDAITIVSVLLYFDVLSKDDLRIIASIDEKNFDKMFDVLVLCQLIDCKKDIVSISAFGKNVIKLTEEFLGENRKINKGHKSNLIS